MQAPPAIATEAGRLDALRRYRVLETPPEDSLDDLTRLAAHVCQAPIALLTLVDADRQWFKSRIGLAVSETPRALSFCAHALLVPDVLVVPDTLTDSRFEDHPLVLEGPKVRFYAGAPLRTVDGHAVGALAVADTVPREPSPEQLDALRVLSRQAMAQLELRRQGLELADRERATTAQRDRAEQALGVKSAELEETSVQLQAALGIARMGVWSGDLRTGEIQTIHGGGPITGLPPPLRPTNGEGFYALVHPDDRASVASQMGRVRETGAYDGEFRIVLPGGEIRWVSSRGRIVPDAAGAPVIFTGVDLDITEGKRAEARIQHLNRVYSVLSDINQTIVREPSLPRVLSEACRIVVERGGFRMAWIGIVDPATGCLERRAQAGADEATHAIIDALITQDPPAGCAFTRAALESRVPAVCDDIAGDPASVSWREAALERGYGSMGAFALVAGDRPVGVLNIYADEPGAIVAEERRLLEELAADIGFAIDVDRRELERQKAEAERHDAEDRFRLIAEAIHQVFWMTDVQGRTLYVSPAYERIFGRTCQSLYDTPRSWIDSVHPDDRERVEQAAFQRASRGDYDEVYRIIRRDGTVRWIRDRAFPVRSASGEVERLLGTTADVTEQRQLEEQLQQAQKMESLGRLAGGVAHDFNNLLTVINGMADLVLAGLADDDPARRDLEQIRQAGDRAATLTSRLLAISRRQILKPEVLDLSAVVDSLHEMIERLVGEDVQLEFAVDPALGSVKADPGQIEQVLLNLVVNARDAMPDGGRLRIETRAVMLDVVYAAEHPGTRPGRHAMIAVRDTGIGMDEMTRRRIFEPFFTTKAVGKGTGLGLSMVYGIVKQSGGSIRVTSEPGRGSSFEIYLPVVAERPAPRPQPAAPAPARGQESILVVEDEPALRELTTRVLQGAGYLVLPAASGADALALLERHAGDVHLVFTDVVMPGMSGRELATRLARLRPGLRVLYTSGYTEDAILRHGVLDDPSRFLSKPYTPAELRRRIRLALDS
jgi:two-component system, cell cycle sensor histidine kinase and response regulator CckA